ncbi:MAG: hypothetical protein ACR2L2_03860 [Acidobacteriota bacterium]
MASLADVFKVVIDLKSEGIINQYAVGGAMAVLFYAEPARTYALDVFVDLPPPASGITILTPIYDRLKALGGKADMEHIIVYGVPVQFLPSHTELVDEAINSAVVHNYEGVPVRVVRPEHLIALAFQAGGARRRERVGLLMEAGAVDSATLRAIMERHDLMKFWREDFEGGDA